MGRADHGTSDAVLDSAGTASFRHYTIEWVEAHGLAFFLTGVLFLSVVAGDGRRFWHRFAIALHVLLAAANLTFWSSLTVFGVVLMGVAATGEPAFLLTESPGLASSAPCSVARER